MGLFDGMEPTTPAQAKRDRVWEELLRDLALCVLPEDIDVFEQEVSRTVPLSYRMPLADAIERKREEIAADDIGRVMRERFDF